MSLPAATTWEVRISGNDGNSGGYVTGSSGVDKSLSDTAAYAFTDLASSNGTAANPQVTSAAHSFDSTDVGNILRVTGGSSWTTGFYQIQSVAGGAATLDRACGSAASLSAGSYVVGGAFASPGQAGAAHVAGNVIWLRAGTYGVSSASSNVSGGCLTLINGTTSNTTKLLGYNATRGDNPTGSGRPLIQAGAISSFTLVNTNTTCYVERVQCDGSSTTLSKAYGANGTFFRCKGLNCKAGAFSGGTMILCEASGCSTVQAFQGGLCYGCVAQNNTNTGFAAGNCFFCFAINCTNGFITSSSNVDWLGCTAYGNTVNGFNVSASANHNTLTNCLAVGNTSTGFAAGSVADNAQLNNCAGYGNGGSGNVANLPNNNGFINLAGNPFTNAAGNDFSLNNTAGAGAACRAAGILGLFPGLATTGYADLGAVQHQDAGGGAIEIVGSAIIRGLR